MTGRIGERGFTLAETMVSLAVFGFFTLIIVTSTTALNRLKSADTIETELMNKARIVMEKVIWGVGEGGERDGIGEALLYNIAGNTFHYTLPDGVERRIVQSQDELTFHKPGVQITVYDPNGEANPPEPQDYSTELTFTQLATDVLQVDLVLGRQRHGRWHYASLSTSIALRN